LEDNRILHINEALKSYGFYQDDQVIGTKEIAGRTWVNLKQRELFYRRLQEKGTITDFEVQFRLSSGEIHLMLLSARLMELGGDQVAIVQAKDVDHIKKEEKEHESYQSHLEELLKEKEAQLKRQVDIPQKKQLAKIPLTRNGEDGALRPGRISGPHHEPTG
jgi:PAS domain S-box-containing protein